jgi:hypothetical protein
VRKNNVVGTHFVTLSLLLLLLLFLFERDDCFPWNGAISFVRAVFVRAITSYPFQVDENDFVHDFTTTRRPVKPPHEKRNKNLLSRITTSTRLNAEYGTSNPAHDNSKVARPQERMKINNHKK